MQPGRTWNGHNPGFLCKQPGKRDLCGRRLLLLRKLAKQINHGLIRFPVLRRKARDDVPEIVLIELRIFVDLAREEALAKRAEWHKSDPQFLERR